MVNRLVAVLEKLFNKISISRKLLWSFIITVSIPLLLAGGFAFGLVAWLTDHSAAEAIQDKTHIASLLLEDQKSRLRAVSQAMATDNLVQINYGLGLMPPIDAWLNATQLRHGLDFALLVDSRGYAISSGNRPGGIFDPREFVPPTALAAIQDDDNRIWAMRLDGSPFAEAENLHALVPGHELSLVSVSPMAGQGNSNRAFLIAGIVLGLGDDKAGAKFLKVLEDNLKVPFVVTDTSRVLLGPEGLGGIEFPDWLAGELGKGSEYSEIKPFVYGLSGWLTQFIPLIDCHGMPAGSIGILYPQGELVRSRVLAALILLVALVLAFMAAIAVAVSLSRMISRPIVAVAESAKSIVKGDWNVHIPVNSNDEIGQMAEEFTVMAVQLKSLVDDLNREVSAHEAAESEVRRLNSGLEEAVSLRTQELSDSNEALAESLDMLRKTQKNLVHSEKMAALGNLVAGIAHELNTPIGSCLTVSTFVEGKLKDFSDRYGDGALTRKDLDDFILLVADSSKLVSSNLRRAAEQIRFFKQIAVDQDAEKPAFFSLGFYVDELVASMGKGFVGPGFQYRNLISSELHIETFASGLYQILHKLISNAWQHGFANRDHGVITFDARLHDSRVVLTVEDDGAGISEANLSRIFDPFFTTARGSGNTGLGLSIAYNLVTSRLGGTITCESTPGKGTRFTLEFPKLIKPDHIPVDTPDPSAV